MAISAKTKKEIARLLGKGLTGPKIAEIAGCSLSTVRRIQREINGAKPEGKGKVSAPDLVSDYTEGVESAIALIRSRETELLNNLWELQRDLYQDVRDCRNRLDPDKSTDQSLAVLAKTAMAATTTYLQANDAIHAIAEIGEAIDEAKNS